MLVKRKVVLYIFKDLMEWTTVIQQTKINQVTAFALSMIVPFLRALFTLNDAVFSRGFSIFSGFLAMPQLTFFLKLFFLSKMPLYLHSF